MGDVDRILAAGPNRGRSPIRCTRRPMMGRLPDGVTPLGDGAHFFGEFDSPEPGQRFYLRFGPRPTMHHRLQRLVAIVPTALLAGHAAAGGAFTVRYVGNYDPGVTQRMNAVGQIAGDDQIAAVTTAVRYDLGIGAVARNVPAGTTQSIALGINDAGVTVGRISPPGTTVSYAARWLADNSMLQLPTPPGTWSYNTASGINNAGTVCGAATLAIVGVDPQQAWRWTERGGYQMLPKLTGVDALAWDINASGEVAGRADITGNLYRAVIWHADGSIQNLGLVAGATQTFAVAINDAGWAVGTTNSNGDAIVYKPGVGLSKLPDFGLKAAAYDINNGGWILGWADTAPFETVPVVWSPDGTLYNIANYVSANQFYFPGDYIVPITIGDNNMIAVRGYDFTVSGDPRILLFQVGFENPCPADLTGDGQVDAADIATLLGDWGAGTGSASDLDGSGSVDAADLAIVLGAWGAC